MKLPTLGTLATNMALMVMPLRLVARHKPQPFHTIMMKYIAVIFILTHSLLHCNNYSENECDISDIQGDWILKYSFTEKNNRNLQSPTKILNFQQDTLRVFNFFSYAPKSKYEKVKTFELKNKVIIYKTEQTIDSFNLVKLSNDTLIIGKSNYYQVFERLPKYEKSKQKEHFLKTLISSIFWISPDKHEIEFFQGGRLINGDLKVKFENDQLWRIEQYKKEIFLVFNDFLGDILHLKKIGPENIQFQFYGTKNKLVKFEEKEIRPIWNKDQLIGIWINESNKDIPPIAKENKEFNYDEILNISDSIIYQSKFAKSEKLKWAFNKSYNRIIFEGNWAEVEKRQWNILKLTMDKLVIERRLKHRNKNNEVIETVKFHRQK